MDFVWFFKRDFEFFIDNLLGLRVKSRFVFGIDFRKANKILIEDSEVDKDSYKKVCIDRFFCNFFDYFIFT